MGMMYDESLLEGQARTNPPSGLTPPPPPPFDQQKAKL